MSKQDKELVKAMASFNKLQKGCWQLIAQYMRDDKPNALEFFLKQTVKMRTGVHVHMEEINQMDKSKFPNPNKEVNKIMRDADLTAKRVVFGNPLWEDEAIKSFPKSLDDLGSDPEMFTFINEQREIYINDLIKKEKDKQLMTPFPIEKEKKGRTALPSQQHSRVHSQSNPEGYEQMVKDTIKLFEN